MHPGHGGRARPPDSARAAPPRVRALVRQRGRTARRTGPKGRPLDRAEALAGSVGTQSACTGAVEGVLVPPEDSTLTKRGGISNEFISVMDLPMTILEYAGVEYPAKTYKDRTLTAPAGISVKPYLEGKRKVTRSEEEWVAFELFGNVYVIAGDYKAIKVRTGMYGDGKWHLYNIKNDPAESTPLESEMPKRLENMIAIYDSYAKEKGVIEVEESWNPWYGSYVPEQSK